VRVVLVNQYYAPAEAATAQLLTDLGEHLVREGHAVTVICSRRSYPDPSLLYPVAETVDGVRVVRTWTTGFGRGSALGRMVDYLGFMAGAARCLVLERDVDVVVSLTTPPLLATVGWVASRLRGACSVCWVMDIYPELAFALGMLRRRSVIGRLLGVVGRATLLRSDAVVALGETMARRLGEDGAQQVSVVHNWADGEAIRAHAPTDSPLRRAWGWGDRCVFLYSGNLGLAHEFDTLLAAAEAVRDDRDILFAFVGDGPRLQYVEREVERRGLRNVEFRPHVSRESLGDSLTAADVHLVTLRDGVAGLVVPSKIYGILAAGRPTLYVGPDVGEVVEILREGDCGLRVAVGDDDSMAEAVRRYSGDEERRGEEGRRARRLFDERFTKQAALRSHQVLLESLVADLP